MRALLDRERGRPTCAVRVRCGAEQQLAHESRRARHTSRSVCRFPVSSTSAAKRRSLLPTLCRCGTMVRCQIRPAHAACSRLLRATALPVQQRHRQHAAQAVECDLLTIARGEWALDAPGRAARRVRARGAQALKNRGGEQVWLMVTPWQWTVRQKRCGRPDQARQIGGLVKG